MSAVFEQALQADAHSIYLFIYLISGHYYCTHEVVLHLELKSVVTAEGKPSLNNL